MQKLISKTTSLLDKARKLVAENEKLRAENAGLENELKKLRLSLEAETLKTSELNNKIKIIKLAQNISPDGKGENPETAELKRKINEYIREIDNCIVMLND